MEKSIPVEADLTLFRPINTMQRRRDRRYRCSLATSAKLLLPSGETLSAWVSNLSRGGVGLDMSRSLPVGLEFTLLLRTVHNSTVRVSVRVAHATPVANGGWRVGGELMQKFTADTLEALL